MIQYKPAADDGNELFDVTDNQSVTYEQFVTNLVKELDNDKQNLIHMLMGITGEAGELMDQIKKHTIYGKELDLENVIEELGDLEFYMAGLRQMLNIGRNSVLSYNIFKLRQRYKSGSYSDAAAIAREDKVPEPALQVIDMSKVVSDEQVRAVDETAGFKGN